MDRTYDPYLVLLKVFLGFFGLLKYFKEEANIAL